LILLIANLYPVYYSLPAVPCKKVVTAKDKAVLAVVDADATADVAVVAFVFVGSVR
jgi:hypothetical protein